MLCQNTKKDIWKLKTQLRNRHNKISKGATKTNFFQNTNESSSKLILFGSFDILHTNKFGFWKTRISCKYCGNKINIFKLSNIGRRKLKRLKHQIMNI